MDAVRFAKIAAPSLLEQPKTGDVAPGAFQGMLKEGFAKLDALEKTAEGEMKKLLTGQPVELHRVVLASEEAGLAFDLMMSVRNKVTDAYQEVMRMQV